MIVERQDEAMAFLSDPASYRAAGVPGELSGIERIETHVSVVFLAGERAFKLKRAARYPYLDFSTLDRRRQACEAEVAINRRTAPALYLGVAAVARDGEGRLTLRRAPADGENVVEWLVEMARFDQTSLFDRLAARGQLDRDRMEELAAAIVRFHAEAEVRRDHGGAAGLSAIVENNALCFAEAAPGLFDADQTARLLARSRAALAARGDLLDARRAAGRVRHCHGDLHLRNICLVDGKPTLFDAIEFSESIACIDTLYDLAFLLMDLDFRGLRELGAVLFNRYVELTDDDGGLAALPLMLATRAAIRSHVGAAAAGQLSGERAREAMDGARRYLERALDYLTPRRPALVAVGGLSGSGKSRLARQLAPHLGAAPGALVARTDALRKRLMGVGLLDRLDAGGYTAAITERTYQALYDRCRRALAAGHGAIADAVFAKPEQRQAIARLAAEMGVPFQGLWVEAPPEVMAERIAKRRRNVSDATVAVLENQLRYDLGPIDWPRIDSSGPKAATLASARRLIEAL